MLQVITEGPYRGEHVPRVEEEERYDKPEDIGREE